MLKTQIIMVASPNGVFDIKKILILFMILLALTPFAEGIASSASTKVIIKIHEKLMMEIPEKIEISNYDLALDNSATGSLAVDGNNPKGWITTIHTLEWHDDPFSTPPTNSTSTLPLRIQVGNNAEMELGPNPIEILSFDVEDDQTYHSLTLCHTGSWNDIPALDHEMKVEFVSYPIV